MEDKIDKIFRATFSLIAENGIHNTPMSAISKKSEVAAGTIYNYFESKDVLINALYIHLKKDLIQNVMKGFDKESTFRESFFQIWRNYYSYLVKNPDILSFMEQITNTPIITEDTKKEADEITIPWAEFLESGMQTGIFKINNIYLIASLIHSSVTSLAKLQISGQIAVTEETREAVAEYSWKGLT